MDDHNKLPKNNFFKYDPAKRIRDQLNDWKKNLSCTSFPLSMDYKNAVQLLTNLKVQKYDTFWEIGCGIPILAWVQLYMTRGTVFATDKSNFDFIHVINIMYIHIYVLLYVCLFLFF